MYISIYLCIYRWANDDDDDTSLLFTILKTYTLKSLVIIYIYIYMAQTPKITPTNRHSSHLHGGWVPRHKARNEGQRPCLKGIH